MFQPRLVDITLFSPAPHPVLTSITPVSKVLTHLTHTHPKTNFLAILDSKAPRELAV